MKPPHNVAFLDRALRALSKTNEESVQLRRVMANVIVGDLRGPCQMWMAMNLCKEGVNCERCGFIGFVVDGFP